MASIETRGKWIRITVERTENGKRVVYRDKIPVGSKQKAIDAAVASLETSVNQGKLTSAMMGATVGTFAQEWFTHHVKTELAASTQDEYQRKLNKFILPNLGGDKIRDVRPQRIIKLLEDLKAKLENDKEEKLNKMHEEYEAGKRTFDTIEKYKQQNTGARQVKYVFQVLNSMFQSAVYWQVIPVNPCASVKTPQYKAPEAGFYDEEQAGAFLAALETIPPEWMAYRLAATLSIFTTLRRSEVLGLGEDDIDLIKHTVTVRQKLYWSKEKGFVLESPKTDKSARTVNIGEYTVALIKEYMAIKNAQTGKVIEIKKRDQSRLLLLDHEGQPIKPYLITSWFSRFIKRHGLSHLSFHGLRHTAVTNMISNGFDLSTVAGVAGHSTPTTTSNIYAHAIENNKKAASNAIESSLLKHKNG